MNIPRFWAEARAQHRERNRQVTVRRFGWSLTSEAEAQANANARVAEALQRILAGEQLPRREPKVAYNGAEGVPIREEIVAQHGATVITRNIYGALCLNTPDVLFADVDFETNLPEKLRCAGVLLFAVLAGCLAWKWNVTMLAIAVGGVLGWFMGQFAHRVFLWLSGGPEKLALRRIKSFVASRPDWRLRLYRTPAGFRVLAMHRVFAPGEPAVAEFFQALHTDPVYVTMCQRQQCFRARVSPKPWRIGITAHVKPRCGVWPVRAEAMPARQAWIESYHEKARAYAACRFVSEMGTGGLHEHARQVQRLHDELCRAESGLPIA